MTATPKSLDEVDDDLVPVTDRDGAAPADGSAAESTPDAPSEATATTKREPLSSLPSKWRLVALAAAGGLVASLGTPPFDLFPLMFVGLGLMGWALHGARGFWRGFLVGLFWAAAGQLVVLRFVPDVILRFTSLGPGLGYLALVLLAFGQSVHWALGMGVAGLLRRRLDAPTPLALGLGVMLALMLPNIFVWSPAGLLSPWPVLVQLADVVGERGVSAMIAIIGFGVVRAAVVCADRRGWDPRAKPPLLVAGGLLALLLGYGAWALPHHRRPVTEAPTVRVALIHAAVDPIDRWQPKNWPNILSTLRNLTAQAETTGIDFSVWPEGAYPYPLPHGTNRAPRGQRQLLAGAAKSPLLFGFMARDQPERDAEGQLVTNTYNSATVVTEDRLLQPSYDKMELLWFGETVPLGDTFPWLRRTFQRSGGLIPGKELRALTIDTQDGDHVVAGVFNCYEDTLPSYGRRVFAELHPNLLVNVTNDAWFVGSEESELHVRLAAMRAIELRRDLVRAVNLGVPAWIDATGALRERNDLPLPGFLTVQASLRDGPPTLYARFGDVPLLVLLGLGIAVAWRRGSERDD